MSGARWRCARSRVSLARARSWRRTPAWRSSSCALVRRAAMPLDNLDTYFHLRFGHEFLSGDWSLRDPGSVSTLRDRATGCRPSGCPQVVMAQTEEWFGLAGRRVAVRAAVPRPGARRLLGLPAPGRAGRRRAARRPHADRLHVGHLDAAPAGQLHPGRRHHRGLAAGPGDRPGAVAARAGHVGLDDVPRDVADRDRDRRRRGARARPRPRSPAPHPGQDGRGAGAVGGRLAAHAGRPRPVPGRAAA